MCKNEKTKYGQTANTIKQCRKNLRYKDVQNMPDKSQKCPSECVVPNLVWSPKKNYER